MKKNWKLFITLLIAIVIPMNVHALSASVNISCGELTVGKTTTCKIRVTADREVASVKANISVTGNASITSVAKGSEWNGDFSKNELELYTDKFSDNKSASIKNEVIGTITISGNKVGTATVFVTNIYISGGDLDNFNQFPFKDCEQNVSIIEKKTNAPTTKKPTSTTRDINSTTTATTTTTKAIPLVPTSVTVDDFPVTLENGTYYVTVNNDTESVNVNATASAGIVIVGTGKRTLARGKNLVELVLRNEQNVTATFQVVITRPEGGEYNTSLRSLKVVDYDLDFKPDTLEYTVSVPFNTKEVYVIADALSDDVSISGDGLYTTNNKTTDIYVTASYGDLKSTKYVIHITKNYSLIFMWCAIGGLGVSLFGLGIYTIVIKSKLTKKTKNALTKAKALENRAVKKEDPNQGIAINGQNVIGLGRQAVVPTNLVKTDSSSDVEIVARPSASQIINDVPVQPATPVPTVPQSPEPQVKVVKKTIVPTTSVKTIIQAHNPAPIPESNSGNN